MSHSGGGGGLEATAAATSSSQRPRHQITRSISELSSPIRLHRQHSRRPIREKERDHDVLSSVVAQTATAVPSIAQGGRLSLDGYPSATVTPNLSPNPSRRTSILFAQSGENGSYNPLLASMGTGSGPVNTPGGPGSVPATAPPVNSTTTTMINNTKASTKADDATAKERQRVAAARDRSAGLTSTLTALSTFQSTSTHRLDQTYYSVLSRLTTLQSTIAGLKELAHLSREMNHTFASESTALVSETTSHLDAFAPQFEEQQARIETLQGRVHVGRDKIKGLSERVDKVKERIERWERADREWQERTRRRLRVVWVVSLVMVALVVGVVVSAQYYTPVPGAGTGGDGSASGLGEAATKAVGDGLEVVKNVTAGGKDMLFGGSSGAGARDGLSDSEIGVDPSTSTGSGASSLLLPSAPSSSSGDGDDVLRVFDEL